MGFRRAVEAYSNAPFWRKASLRFARHGADAMCAGRRRRGAGGMATASSSSSRRRRFRRSALRAHVRRIGLPLATASDICHKRRLPSYRAHTALRRNGKGAHPQQALAYDHERESAPPPETKAIPRLVIRIYTTTTVTLAAASAAVSSLGKGASVIKTEISSSVQILTKDCRCAFEESHKTILTVERST
jgi:hypothetical protein